MASSIKAEPGLDLFYGTQTSYKQQLKGHQASYSCFSKTPTLPIIGLQSRDKAVMLVIKSIIFFPKILCQNGVHFPEERNTLFLTRHEHGHRDVTCKPATLILNPLHQ